MLDQNLINKIESLQKIIKAFKEYDKERKQYYSQVVQENGELKSYIDELIDTDKRNKKLDNYKKLNVQLQKYIEIHKVRTELSDDEIITLSNAAKEHMYKKQCQAAEEKIKSLTKRIRQLEQQLYSLIKQNEKLS